MAEDKKLVEAITSMDVDFAQWYTDVVKKAELMAYSSVKGCMIFKPAGYAIWENIQKLLCVLSGFIEQGNVLGIPNVGGRTGGIHNHGAAVTTLARIMIRVIIRVIVIF